MFLGGTGGEANHHFLIPRDGSAFRFTEGRYRLDVFAKLLGDENQKVLFHRFSKFRHSLAVGLEEPGSGMYFDWGPDSSRYLAHVGQGGPRCRILREVLDMLGLARHQSQE